LNLLLIAQKVWRYKLATLPILVFVLIGSFYVVAIKTPVYEASSTYNLLPALPPPTADQIAADPRLGRIDTNNPYTRYSDQSVVVQVLASRLSSDAARAELVSHGADPGYVVAPSVELGYTAPILQVTGTGPTAQEAITTANLVGDAAKRELKASQDKVAPDYRITMHPVVLAHDAQLKASGQLRALVGVWAIGGILLFVVVSVADAVSALRRDRRDDDASGGSLSDAGEVPALEPVPAADEEQATARSAANGTSSKSQSKTPTGPNGGSAGHPQLVIPPAMGGWSDPEREGTSRHRRTRRRPRASGR
jgi:hypothetical protein